jgi:SAM-dependent methyltransferase
MTCADFRAEPEAVPLVERLADAPPPRFALDRALWGVRESAHARGEFVGQQGFMSASEVLGLADRAGVGPGVAVLDLCCGIAGPGLFATASRGCTYLGVDEDPQAIAGARQRADHAGLDVDLEVGHVPPLPAGRFDVVLLLETLLAFRDKQELFEGIRGALGPGGRVAFTVEEGLPLTETERQEMPSADTVWLTSLSDLLCDLARTGFQATWLEEHTSSHRATVDSLVWAYTTSAPDLRRRGLTGVDDLVTSHLLWSRWLREGRVRKFAVVARKV